jgi:hypothetical protein
MNPNDIDAGVVIELLRKENEELRWQLTLWQAKAVQAARAAEAEEGA